jgi:hypothetical protein
MVLQVGRDSLRLLKSEDEDQCPAFDALIETEVKQLLQNLPKNIKKEQLERVRNHPFPGIAALKTKKGEEEARQHRYTYTHCHMLAAWWVRRGGADVTEVPATIEIDV